MSKQVRNTNWLRILITIAMVASYVIVPEPRPAYASDTWTQTTSAHFNTDTVTGDAYVSGDAVYVKVPEDGEGDDGSATISTSKNINTDIIEGGRSYADGIVTAVSAISTNSVTVASINGFAAGDKALLINMQGSATYNGNVGKNEILDVSSAASTTVTFTSDIAKIYGASASNSDLTDQKIMLQRVPQYSTVTIQSGGTLTCSAWDGTSGGVVAFCASGTVDVQSGGKIDVDQKGFRAGTSSGPEGYTGRTTGGGDTGGAGGCGGETSGGAGGSSTYGGGGGDSKDDNGSPPNNSTYGGDGGAGADTGHATESTVGSNGSSGSPGRGGGGGGCVYRPCAGGGGGSPYDSETNDSQSNLSKIMLGGGASKGGGGGTGGSTCDCNECSGTRAGGGPAGGGGGNAGGGMVIIKGGGTVTVAGNIYSRGGSGGGGGGGGNGSNRIWCYDGAGGGGGGGADGAAGGSVLIYGDAVTLGTSLVVATAGSGGSGGSGGNPGTPASSNAKGGGSGGSGSTGSTGKTAVFYETSKSGSSSPGDGGTQQDLNDGTGTITSTTVDYDDCSGASTWDEITWNDTETNGSITYQVEYDTDGDGGGDTWALIPDGALSNNSTGFGTSGVDISGLNTTTYNRIRLKATLAYSGGSPSLNDWTVAWITNAAPSTPTTALLFDNQKAGTTTPAFKFTGTDPDSDNLDYQITWDDDINFGSATTKSSSDYPTDAGWTAATFTSATQVTYTVQAGDALTNGTTYWWKVRTRDPGGLNTWSGWTTAISFTIDTSLTAAAAWHQTTKEQFDNDTAAGTVAPQDGTDDVRMTGP